MRISYKCLLQGLVCAVAVALLNITTANADVVPAVHRNIHSKILREMDDARMFQALVDSLTYTEEMMEEKAEEPQEFELYPALDLYGSWDDAHVNPLIGKNDVKIPDEADIDMRGFYPPIMGRITSPYGWRRRRMHRGTDIKLYVGDTVRAAFDGQVRIRKFDRRGYGYYYVVRHPNGLETVYGHLSKHIVQQGDYVRAGQALGLGGNTGRSTGSHLHLEFRFMGIDLDPASLIDFDTFRPKMQTYHFVHKKARAVSSGDATGSGEAKYHRVKSGDTLGGIARRYGTSVARLCKLNGIRSNKVLQIGQRIRYR